MNSNPSFNKMLDILKDNEHCPAHRNCEKCGYNHQGGCKLMQMVTKLINAGTTIPEMFYDVGTTVYLVIPYIPTTYRCIIRSIHWGKYGNSKTNQKIIHLDYTYKNQTFVVSEDYFGKTLFFNKEDAENVIASWKSNGLR